ncbi:MAG: alanine--glyoxylate aminotransferase family protein [Caldisericota bacterium]|nr:alanine--glyoxylate aminotransferase family protein [Caldisericota bacterium]
MEELLLIPGPTPVSKDVLKALSQNTISHTDERFVEVFLKALNKMKPLFGTRDGQIFIIAGSGTLGMEIALTNILEENENILVVSHGYFGDRFVEIGKTLGLNVDLLKSKAGMHINSSFLANYLTKKKYKAVTFTHVDTSTGVMTNMKETSKIIKEVSPDTLTVLDGVCATGGIPEKMDEWGIDVLFTGSQKAIAVPPGLTMLAFSARAISARKEMKKMRTYYADILRWVQVMENPHKYFATPAVNMIFALEKSLDDILRQGLDKYHEKHRILASLVRTGMKTFGFKNMAAADIAAPTLSVFIYPPGIDDAGFRSLLKEKGVTVAGAIGELKGKCFRMGHMGSVTEEDILHALNHIGQVIKEEYM